MYRDVLLYVFTGIGGLTAVGLVGLLAVVVWFKLMEGVSNFFKITPLVKQVLCEKILHGRKPIFVKAEVADEIDRLRTELNKANDDAYDLQCKVDRLTSDVKNAEERIAGLQALRRLEGALASAPLPQQVDAPEDGQGADADHDHEGR